MSISQRRATVIGNSGAGHIRDLPASTSIRRKQKDPYLPLPTLAVATAATRSRPPVGKDHLQLTRVVEALREQQRHRVSAIVCQPHATGRRLREAILADLPRLQREAKRFARTKYQEGTKGGRSGASAPRWVIAPEFDCRRQPRC